MQLTVDTLEFHFDKNPKRFVIISNLPQNGLTIENAFSGWISQAKDITPSSLSLYIRSRGENIVCYTEDEYFKKVPVKIS